MKGLLLTVYGYEKRSTINPMRSTKDSVCRSYNSGSDLFRWNHVVEHNRTSSQQIDQDFIPE